ncbi:DNA (cytosine-5-)-methyltransferase [Ferrovibrio terrae]|uniref:DNA cytosine methyltransferase n=1 Tax=Ferrovibrio terrae TaxID=2594003 RepID=UPI0031382681
MKYISLFSGAGGLEHPSTVPLLVCEKDEACIRVLERRVGPAQIHRDVNSLQPPKADVVVGGWPCQDISIAGSMAGLSGARSGLFYRMVEIAIEAGSHTIVAENVPNLLTMNGGKEFEGVLAYFRQAGYPFISWRTLNARQFGLPQDRKRVFMVASKVREIANTLHAQTPSAPISSQTESPRAAGFYWTAGGRSICFNRGYTPALKVGASDNKGRSVVAVFTDGQISKLSADGCARLQGFTPEDFEGETKTDIVRMAGNAVAVPMGHFVMSLVFEQHRSDVGSFGAGLQVGFAEISENGFSEDGFIWTVAHPEAEFATNLDEFVQNDTGEPLSGQAAAGLIVRSARSGHALPLDLFDSLLEIALRGGPIRGSRSNSFNELKELDLSSYRNELERVFLSAA